MSSMSTNEADPAAKPPGAFTAAKPLGVQLKEKQSNFAAALPAHIPVERFMRVVLTATQMNPELLKADRASLWNSCMRAAQDGLLPDGRDGALVIYNTKVAGNWIAKVQWMPMVGGIRKKVRNSGTMTTWDVHVVHARDSFDFELGDDPYIKHRPYMPGPLAPKGEKETDEAFEARRLAHIDRGPTVAVYSVATLKSGEKSRDVMTRAEVDYVRDTYSKKTRDGRFSPAWVNSYDEMAKKTVARRHSKVLPMSSDLDDLMRRDDVLYDLDGAGDKKQVARANGAPRTAAERIDALIAGAVPDETPEQEDEDEGEGALIEDAEGDLVNSKTGEVTKAAAATSEGAGAGEAAAEAKPAGAGEAAASVSASPSNTPSQGAGGGSPAAEGGAPAPTGAKAAAGQTPVPAAADPAADALLADLIETGQARAERGSIALRHFLDGLELRERKLLPAPLVEAWIKNARAKSAKGDKGDA